MLSYLRKLIPDTHPVRLAWHFVCGFVAAVRYGFPAKRIKVVLVTGTKGKTTTSWVLGSLLQESGYKTAVATTALFRRGKEVWVNQTKMTTLGRFELQRFLSQAVKAKCKYAVIEASSQAAVQSRLFGISAEGLVWTNLQQDHLEYHQGWENYRAAKGKLIENVKQGGFVVLNADDNEADWFAEQAKGKKVLWVGLGKIRDNAHYFRVQEVKVNAKNLSFGLGKLRGLKAGFTGKFNLLNLSEALVAALSLGVSEAKLKKILPIVRPVPGRLEEVENKRGVKILIDFAYTPEALKNALQAAREGVQKDGKVWVMFGAVAGGRDVRKRSVMGAEAEKGAERIVLTDDDLGEGDDSAEVISGIVAGFSGRMKKEEGKSWWRITPREKAVEFVLNKAKKGDVVLFAGKGCETVQHYGKRQRKYNERTVVESCLSKLD